MTNTLPNFKFDNAVLKELPVDKEYGNRQRQVSGACFSITEKTPVENPKLVSYSQYALDLLDIKETDLDNDLLVEFLAGNKSIDGSQSAAHCYCGHQFGYFSGQLGDGAAMYLGEIINQKNERWELQLKGSGLTPFSRHADGRKVLRSSIREFLCSEAMFHLGIPTTRAGTCITSDSQVVRDMFYDGHPKMEKCTIVSRIAPTFLRFGSFEIFKPQDSQTGRTGPSVNHKGDILPTMLDYVVKYFYPEIEEQNKDDKAKMYLEFYKEIIKRTAKLVAQWQCVGFCHGVLNTDNMSIVGVTIDYGPFGFMEYFDADHICNSSDNNGRYAYTKQPEICKWNLWKLGEAIRDCFPSPEQAKEVLNEIYDKEFSKNYYGIMRSKLGLQLSLEKDAELVQKLLLTMQKSACDFTNTFCVLTDVNWFDENAIVKACNLLVKQCQDVEGLKKRLKSDYNSSQLSTLLQLSEQHPQVLQQFGLSREDLIRMVQQAESQKKIAKLNPEEKLESDKELWTEWLHLYRSRVLKELKDLNDPEQRLKLTSARNELMCRNNPRVVLRNHLAQEAIEAAETGDYSKVSDLLKVLENPYEQPKQLEDDVTTGCRSFDVTKYTSTGRELLVS